VTPAGGFGGYAYGGFGPAKVNKLPFDGQGKKPTDGIVYESKKMPQKKHDW